MALIKCKMCGGDLILTPGQSTAECEYCGSMQTVPTADNEKKLTLFARANRLRLACEFDKAENIYESIAAEFPEEAEAYWGLVLCKYGIEYVDDPATGKKIPTCHRSSFDSIMEDSDLEQALENADLLARRVYREEAKTIEEIRKGIISVSAREEPYDIFICYKETGEKGERTLDSVLAQDVYDALTDKGYRVFFSRISLEDKLGVEYEPYIFSALNSAKIMLVVGTDYEYFNAVWVKNEWSRFLKLMTRNKEKYLIPCFKGIDAYDMPREFAKLQAQDLGKIGATQDLLRGIEKLMPAKIQAPSPAPEPTAYSDMAVNDLLRKVTIHLQEKSWKNVQDTCNRIMALDPENPWAYIYQLARVMRVTDPEQLPTSLNVISNSSYYEKAMRYADPALREKLQAWCRGSEESYRQAVERCRKGRENAWKVHNLVSAGKYHTAVVLTDGTVVTRGKNEKGQCETGQWRDIIAVACGDETTVGLRRDGTVVACGDNEAGQCDVSEWTDIISISCDQNHTAGLRVDGTVVTCGSTSNNKREVGEWSNLQAVVCGYHHTVGQQTDGTFVSCGSNRFGQLNISSWKDIVALYAQNTQTVGLQRNGMVVGCGSADEQQLDVKQWRDIVDIGMGTHHTVGLKTDGTVVACGSDGQGRRSGTARWTNIIGLARSYWHTFGIRADGTIAVCGDMEDAMSAVSDLKVFENLETLEEERIAAREKRRVQDEIDRKNRELALWRSDQCRGIIAGGTKHLLINRLNGVPTVYGDNESKQCNVSGWKNVVSGACGEMHTVGLKTDGTVLACGDNTHGQCDVSKWTNIIAVACGAHHTIGLRANGTVVACGKNEDGQCDLREWTDIVAVAGGYYHTLGLRADGTVVAKGENGHNQCDVESWRNITAIAACNIHSVGLKADGSVISVGATEDDRRKTEDWRNIVAVACGSHHTLGLKEDGTVVSCGFDGNNRVSQVRQWKQIVGIACGMWCSVGIHPDGTLEFCGELPNASEVRKHKLFESVDTLAQSRERIRSYKTNIPLIHKNWQQRVSVEANAVLSADGRVILLGQSGIFDRCRYWTDVVALEGDNASLFGLRRDGTVLYDGILPRFGVNGVDCWEDIVQIRMGDAHIVGLKQDGTVVALGQNSKGQCDVSEWRNVVSVCCGESCTMGLRSDGKVLSCGEMLGVKLNTQSWGNILSIACGRAEALGIHAFGSVRSNRTGRSSAEWGNMKEVSCGGWHTVGLKRDGTVICAGDNEEGQCNVNRWQGILAVAGGSGFTCGIEENGMLHVSGGKKYGNVAQFNGMNNIVAVAASGVNILMLRADGVVLGVKDKQAHGWRVYDSIEPLLREDKVFIPQDPAVRTQIRNQILQIQYNRRANGQCQHCGGALKGLAIKKCADCGRRKDY